MIAADLFRTARALFELAKKNDRAFQWNKNTRQQSEMTSRQSDSKPHKRVDVLNLQQ